jgi:hypothetical protein
MNNNLEDKISLLYDFIYSKSFKNRVDIDNISLDNINLSDIKFSKNTDENYQNMLDEIFNGKFKLINYNTKTYTTMLKRYSDTFSISVNITPYRNLKYIDNFDEPNNNDALFSYMLSPLVLRKKTKHILLPILNIDMDFQQLNNIINPYESFNDYVRGIENNIFSNLFSVRIKENFFKGKLLNEYLQEKHCDIKTLLFQVIHTLATLQDEFKGFRHNMLNFNNIYVYEKQNNIEKYNFDNTTYYVNNDGIEIKITNFYSSILPGYFSPKSKVPYSSQLDVNDYFDLHYFLNRLIHSEYFNYECNKETKQFFDKVIPKKYRNKTNNYYLEEFVELHKPKDLLKDEYFKEFLNKKDIIKNINENEYYMNRLNVKLDSDNEDILGIINKNKDKYKGIREISNKNIKSKKINKSIYNMSGGAKINLPNAPVKNNPFVSNETRNLYNRDKEEKPEQDKPKNEVVAEQKIIKNPHYKPKFKPTEKPTWDPEHQPKDKKIYVPQGVVHSKTEQTMPKYEKKTITEQPLLAEQKIYQQNMPQPLGHKHPIYNYPAYITPTNQQLLPPPFVQDYDSYPWPHSIPLKKINEIPLQKIYNINLSNADQQYGMLNSLYEDILPGDPFVYSMIKISEREELRKFIKNSIIKSYDGDDITIQPAGSKSLLSHFKILHFNPYGIGNKNPFTNFPKNFLIYNMVYPVHYEDGKIENAKKSMGYNLRIYNLNKAENTFRDAPIILPTGLPYSEDDSQVWREIKYYQQIKTNVINTKKSPNFITMLFYGKDRVSKIKYTELERVINNYDISLSGSTSLFDNIQNTVQLKEYFGGDFKPVNLNDDSGVSLLVITEAPNYNILEWASPVYNKFSARHEMVSTGVHTESEWKSVLFQLVHACYILEQEKLSFNNFTLENNIFIKDLFVNKSNVNHWKYKVDNFEFYIPNYGYLVLIDSRFIDNAVGDKINFNVNINLKPDLNNMLNNLLNLNTPINNIINNIINSPTIKDALLNNFNQFLHNKLGELLITSERNNLSITRLPDLRKGSLVVYQERYEQYKWVIIKDILPNGKYRIIDNINNTKDVFPHSLLSYPKNEIILQTNKPPMKFDTDSLIETYQN